MWRSLIPGSDKHLEIASNQSVTVTKKSDFDIERSGYPLGRGTETEIEIDIESHFLTNNIHSRSLFALGDDSLLSRKPFGFYCRYWFKIQSTQNKVTWKHKSIINPSLTTLNQTPAEDCFIECGFITRGILKDLEVFSDKIEELEREYTNGLKTLVDTSRDLIQLEFNLSSIAEAQKSRTTNLSMKRLSWITFIFLPLMFIASLFGMNVDVLANDPPWWIYVPFASGTMFLTWRVG
ncbi:hypothetical protein VTH82DRAFT_4667 [Thermothelomyces myriococcoides]